MSAALPLRAESFASRAAPCGGRPASWRGGAERRGCGQPHPRSRRPRGAALQAELVADAAQQVLRVDAELLQLVAVLLGVDSIGQLLLGLLDLVVGAALAQHLEDLVLRDLHGAPLVGWVRPRAVRCYSGSGRSSPGHVPTSLRKPCREPWSARPRTSRKIAPSS